MSAARSLYLVFVCTAFCGCVPAKRPALSPEQRIEQLTRCSDFSLRGKIAVQQFQADGRRDGGSGRFQWKQSQDLIDFSLSAPLSQQTWRLIGMPGAFELTDSKGATRQNASAEQLVFDASGWTLPVAKLQRWILGLPDAPKDTLAETYDESGKLKTLSAEGWRVDFQSYDSQEPQRPNRIRAQHPNALIKLIVQEWGGCE